MSIIAPTDAAGVVAAIRAAHDAGTPVAICGNASKSGLLRPVQAASTLSTSGLAGITLYSPQELILAAGPGTTVADLAETVAAKGQHLISELPDLAAFYGNTTQGTLGGMVAMDWAAAYPSDFGRVVLVNTSAGNLAAPWERMDLAIVPQLVAAARSDDLARRERIVLGFTSRLAPDLDRVAETWAGYAKDRPLRVETLLRQIFAATRFRAPKSLGVRALVVAGARDPLAHPVCAERLAAHFHAPLAVHPGAGHDLPLDDGPWLAETVRSWRDG